MFDPGCHPLPVVLLDFDLLCFPHRFAGDLWEIDTWIVPYASHLARPDSRKLIIHVERISPSPGFPQASPCLRVRKYGRHASHQILSKGGALQYFDHHQIVGLLLDWWPRADSIPASLSWGLLKDVQNSVRSTRMSADPSSEYSQSSLRLHRTGLCGHSGWV